MCVHLPDDYIHLGRQTVVAQVYLVNISVNVTESDAWR